MKSYCVGESGVTSSSVRCFHVSPGNIKMVFKLRPSLNENLEEYREGNLKIVDLDTFTLHDTHYS